MVTVFYFILPAVRRLSARARRPLDAVFNYPTLAECYKVAALDAANKLSA